MAGKNVNFYSKKSNQVAPSEADLGMIMWERTSPLFQMLMSAGGGEGSSPSKNHVEIRPLRKLTCE